MPTVRIFLRLLVSTILLISLSAAGCGGGDDNGGTNPATPPDLGNVSLSAMSSLPMARIEVTGLPAAKTTFRVAVLAADGSDAFTLPLESPAAGNSWFQAPFHPTVPNSGGPVRLQITGGSARSAIFDFELGALPAAPGSFAQYVASLQEHIDQRAQAEGSSFDELAAQDFADVPLRLLPFKFAQSFVDDPNTADCLARIADGTSTYLDAGQRDLLDSMFGYANIDSLVRAEIDRMTGSPLATLSFPADVRAGTVVDKECVNMGPAIGGAGDLSAAMQKAFDAKIATDPNGAPGKILAATGLALGAAAFVPALAPVAAVAGAGLYAYQTSREYFANTYPSDFVRLEFDLEMPNMPEDLDRVVHWLNVEAVATSKGWVADKAIFDGVMQLVGAGLGLTQIGEIAGSTTVRDAALADVGMGVGFYLDGQPGGVVEFCPQQWSVDISGLPFSRGEAVIGRVSVSDFQEITPLMVGADVIRVSAVKEMFGFRTVSGELPVETLAIQVTATPDVITVQTPGEIVSIAADIANAEVLTLDWRPEQGAWNDGHGNATNTPGVRPLQTPTDPALYPFLVTIESLSRQGLRATGNPPRVDAVTVRYQPASIVVNPGYVCVANGDTETFTATVQGLDNPAVTWSVEALTEGGPVVGSISQGGVFTAPASGAASVFVVATSQQNPEISGRTEIDVGACTCTFDLTIQGAGLWTGDYAAHSFGTGGLPFTLTFGYTDPNAEPLGLAQVFVGSLPGSGETGSWDCNFSWFSGTATWVATNSDGTSASLEIHRNTGAMIQGSISGTALTPVNGQAVYNDFILTFRSSDAGSGEFICGEQ